MAFENRKSSVDIEIKVGAITLDNVSDIPDLGGAPEQIEVTAIGDGERRYIAGIKDVSALEFTCFYEKETFDSLAKLTEAQEVVIQSKSDTGASLKVTFSGKVSVHLLGFGVGDAITYTLTIIPTTEIQVNAAA